MRNRFSQSMDDREGNGGSEAGQLGSFQKYVIHPVNTDLVSAVCQALG